MRLFFSPCIILYYIIHYIPYQIIDNRFIDIFVIKRLHVIHNPDVRVNYLMN